MTLSDPIRILTASRGFVSDSWAFLLFVFHSKYASIYYRFRDIAAYWSKIATPLYSARTLGVKLSDLLNDPW